jgi:hypothetical protein
MAAAVVRCAQAVLGLVAVLGLSGCASTHLVAPVTVGSQDEAAAVLVAPTSVAPWSQVSGALQPTFSLSASDALQQAVPATLKEQEAVMNAFGASLGLGLPQISKQSTVTRTASMSANSATDAEGVTKTTSTSAEGENDSATRTKQAGTAPQAPTGVPLSAQLPVAAALTGEAGVDPVLKYQAAMSLYQSVQMMNREVANAASVSCFVPFVVRLKIAVVPYRPNLSYTAHTRISFFPIQGASASTRLVASTQTGGCSNADKLPQVVPLLAADDIERTLKSRATQAATQLGLAVSFLSAGTAGNAAVNNVNQALESISGQDFNSRLLISRQSDNTLYVRIGATNQATSGGSLSAQTYDVAVLLLAPRGYFDQGANLTDKRIRLVAYTELRDARDGHVLPSRSQEVFVGEVDRVVDQVLVGRARAARDVWDALDADGKEDVARDWLGPVQISDYAQFLERVNCETKAGPFACAVPIKDLDEAYKQSLWAALSAVTSDSSFKSAFLDLQPPAGITVPRQSIFLIDDGKAATTIRLAGVTGSAAASIQANLHLTTGDLKVLDLPARGIAQDPQSGVLTLSFPSLKALNVESIKEDADSGELQLSAATCPKEALCPTFSPPGGLTPLKLVRPEDKPDKGPAFTAQARTAQILTDKGQGTVTVLIGKLKDEPALVSVQGGDVVSAVDGAGASLVQADGTVVAAKDAAATLTLRNLRAGVPLVVTVETRKGDDTTGTRTLTIPVSPL